MDYESKVKRLAILARNSPIAMQFLSAHETCMHYAPLERQSDVDECLLDALEATTDALARTLAVVQGNPFAPRERPLPLAAPGKSCKAESKTCNRRSLKDLAWECAGLVFGYVGEVLGEDCELSRERNAVIFTRPSTGQEYSLDLSTFAASMIPARAIAAQIARALTEARPPR